ncbi:PREDICTED: uncharacterized protein LOC107071082 [Polistes dominula]|uniref:Uncharacterized protein LOC107071082 n=1 Tax=Polistes dominula TaxID=743375 RepID=A0ABM1IYH8_POLDO|nr:PREDICTED: uncharacterized protein LOC107071082 [Polistes dominula]
MKKQIHEEKEDKSFCECRRKRCCDRREQNQKMRKRVKYRSRRKRKRKDNWLTNCLRKLCFCVKTPVSYEQPNAYERSRETLLQSCKCCNTYRDKHKGTSKKSHHSKNTIFLADDKKTLREDTARYHRANGLEQKCQCINTIAKNRETSQHQSYLQGVLSKGFNIMCRGINFCI